MNRWSQVVSATLIVCGLCAGVWMIGTRFFWPTGLPDTSLGSDNHVTVYRVATPTPQVKKVTIDLPELYRLIGAYRTEHRLTPLSVDARLERSAQSKLDIMLQQAKFGHLDENNQPNWSLLTQASYDYALAGENLAFSGLSAWQVFEAWTKSATHSQQLLKPEYMDMGAAVNCPDAETQLNETGCLVVLHLAKIK